MHDAHESDRSIAHRAEPRPQDAAGLRGDAGYQSEVDPSRRTDDPNAGKLIADGGRVPESDVRDAVETLAKRGRTIIKSKDVTDTLDIPASGGNLKSVGSTLRSLDLVELSSPGGRRNTYRIEPIDVLSPFREDVPAEWRATFDRLTGAGRSPSGVAAAIRYETEDITQAALADEYPTSTNTIREIRDVLPDQPDPDADRPEVRADGGQSVPEQIRAAIAESEWPELSIREVMECTGLTRTQVTRTADSMGSLEYDASLGVVRLPEDDGGEFVDDYEDEVRADGGGVRKYFYLILDHDRRSDLIGNVESTDHRKVVPEKNEAGRVDHRDLETGAVYHSREVGLGYHDFDTPDPDEDRILEVMRQKLADVDREHLEEAGLDPDDVLPEDEREAVTDGGVDQGRVARFRIPDHTAEGDRLWTAAVGVPHRPVCEWCTGREDIDLGPNDGSWDAYNDLKDASPEDIGDEHFATDGGTSTDGELTEALSTVISSRYRAAVIQRLADGPATPSTIAESSDPDIAHVSRSLTELREIDLVELLVPEDTKKGRIYGLSDRGEALLDAYQDVVNRNAPDDDLVTDGGPLAREAAGRPARERLEEIRKQADILVDAGVGRLTVATKLREHADLIETAEATPWDRGPDSDRVQCDDCPRTVPGDQAETVERDGDVVVLCERCRAEAAGVSPPDAGSGWIPTSTRVPAAERESGFDLETDGGHPPGVEHHPEGYHSGDAHVLEDDRVGEPTPPPESRCVECGEEGHMRCGCCSMPLCHKHHEVQGGFCKRFFQTEFPVCVWARDVYVHHGNTDDHEVLVTETDSPDVYHLPLQDDDRLTKPLCRPKEDGKERVAWRDLEDDVDLCALCEDELIDRASASDDGGSD